MENFLLVFFDDIFQDFIEFYEEELQTHKFSDGLRLEVIDESMTLDEIFSYYKINLWKQFVDNDNRIKISRDEALIVFDSINKKIISFYHKFSNLEKRKETFWDIEYKEGEYHLTPIIFIKLSDIGFKTFQDNGRFYTTLGLVGSNRLDYYHLKKQK